MQHHLVFRALKTERTAQTDEQAQRQQQTFAMHNEFYGAPGTVLLASSIPRQMTYYLMPSLDYALAYFNTLSAAEMQWFFLVEGNRPVSLYIDFDGAPALFDSARHFHSSVALCIAYLTRFLDACYYTADGGDDLAQSHYDGEWRLFDSSIEAKWSMHAHCRLMFQSVRVLAGVMQSFVSLLETELQHHDPRLKCLFGAASDAGQQSCILDMSVYNANGRLFRMPLSRKTSRDSNPLLPLCRTDSVADAIRWGVVHPAHGACVDERRLLGEPSAPAAQADLPLHAAFEAAGAPPALVRSLADLPPSTCSCTAKEAHAYCSVFLARPPSFSDAARGDLCALLSAAARLSVAGGAPLSTADGICVASDFAARRAALQAYASTTTLRVGMVRTLPQTKHTKPARINAAGHTRLQAKLQKRLLCDIQSSK
jgi:hypothetical protein